MLTGWSRHQVSHDPIQPSKYMLDAAVEKDFADGRGLEVRTPVPELLIGHPAVFQSALKIPKSALRYRVATLSFATEDIDVAKFNTGDVQSRQAISVTVDLFLEMAFAGIPPDHRPPVLVGTHTHTGRLEINFGIPRYVINSSGKVRSFNPHPPMKGSKIYWDAFGDFLNERFGWANPRAAEQASQIKGPDWAEKRVAAADRFGQKFDPENNPRLFLLQSAKEHARHHQARNPALFWEAFWGAVRSTEYRSTPDENGRLWLTSPRGDPLLLKGGLINSQENCSGRSEKLEVKHDISSLWQRRADQNSAAFSTGAWCEPPPIWAAYSKFSLMELPTHHPDFDPPTPNDGVLHFVSLTARFSAALRAVRSILTRKVAGLMVRRGLASLPPNFFMAIRQKLENLENEYPCNAVWTVPADRVKGSQSRAADFRVPLSDAALRIMDACAETHDRYLFPAERGSGGISDVALHKTLNRIGETGRPHGFRTSFRTWVQETEVCSFDVAETVLGHMVSGKVERAYARSDLLDQRQVVMEKWAAHVTGQKSVVVPLRRGG
jgi:hypothetical protein